MSGHSSLKALRVKMGLSLRAVEALARDLCQAQGDLFSNYEPISNAYLSQLETGKIKSPSMAKILTLSAIYKVPVVDLATSIQRKVSLPDPCDSTSILDLKDRIQKLLHALDSAHYYIDAHPRELKAIGVSRDMTLYRSRELRDEIDPILLREERMAEKGPSYPILKD